MSVARNKGRAGEASRHVSVSVPSRRKAQHGSLNDTDARSISARQEEPPARYAPQPFPVSAPVHEILYQRRHAVQAHTACS